MELLFCLQVEVVVVDLPFLEVEEEVLLLQVEQLSKPLMMLNLLAVQAAQMVLLHFMEALWVHYLVPAGVQAMLLFHFYNTLLRIQFPLWKCLALKFHINLLFQVYALPLVLHLCLN